MGKYSLQKSDVDESGQSSKIPNSRSFVGPPGFKLLNLSACPFAWKFLRIILILLRFRLILPLRIQQYFATFGKYSQFLDTV